jgi:hypothetical protein
MAMDGGPKSPAGSRRRRVLMATGAALLLVLAVAVGVVLGAGGGDSGKGGGTAAGTGGAAVGSGGLAPTGGGGQVQVSGGAGAGGRASAGGGTGGASPTTIRATTTTSPATSTTTGATTTTSAAPLAYAELPSGGAWASCTPSKTSGYDYRVHFQVIARFTGSGTFHSQWGQGRADVRVGHVDVETRDASDTRPFQWQDDMYGNSPSRTDTVVDHLHILDPPGLATTVTITHTICP